jgi:outer membrane lipoprotein carrier protein
MKHRFYPVVGLTVALVLAGCDRGERGEAAEAVRTPGSPAVVAEPATEAGQPQEFGTGGMADADSPVSGAAAPQGGEVTAAPAGQGAPVSAAGGTTAPAAGAATPTAPTSDAPAAAPPAPAPQAPVTAVQAPAGTDANDILQRAERVHSQLRSMEADFVQEVYVPLLDSTQRSRGRIFHRSPDRFLMRFSDPQGDVIVADGRYIWMYYPSNDPRQVMRSSVAQQGGQPFDLHREFLADATRRFSAVRTGTENVGGRQAHALTLTPRTPSGYQRIRLWVDADDSLVRRFEILEQNESLRRLELSNLRTNPNLSDDLFRFTPPPGATVFEP